MRNTWMNTQLGNLITLAYGKSLPETAREAGRYPVYGSNGVVGSHIEAAVSGPGIIVGRKGSCGEVHYCESDFWPIDTTYFVELKKDANLIFTAYLLSSLGLTEMNSHSTIPGLNRESVYCLPIHSPPLPEQKKIAAVLLKIQRAIETQDKIIQSLRDLKKSTMQHLFTHGLHCEKTKMTDIGEIPESWDVVNLSDVMNLFAGYAFKSREAVSISNTQLLRMGNLYQNNLDLERKPIFYPDSYTTKHKRFVLNEGDLVISLTGTSGKEDYGFTVKIPNIDNRLLLNQRVTRIDIIDSRLQKDFAHYFLLSRKFLDFLYPTAKGMKQANLSTNSMKDLKIVLPDEQEQINIANCFKSLDKKIGSNASQKTALQHLFKTTLNKLMTGNIRVTDLDVDVKVVEI